ncbi:MAG: SRPBCC family protein [Actinomycetes bacterium]
MATFVVRRDVAAPASAVWDALTDWPAHGRWVPFTTVTVTGGTGGTGTTFVGRTALGPLGFDDPMEVVRWQPPTPDDAGVATIRKTGRVVLGWAEARVEPLGPGLCRVVWTEDVVIAPAAWTGWAAPLVRLGGRLAFGYLLRRAAREASEAARG